MERHELREFSIDRSECLDVLSDRERVVFVSRVSEAPHQVRTLGQLAEEFGLSRERVRQIEAEAFDKIRRFKEQDARKCSCCDGRGWR